MELEGSLAAFKFSEILQFLSMGRMTGVLSVTQDDRRVQLSFKEGKIIGASSTEDTMQLGQMLVDAGYLTRKALDEALDSEDHTFEKKALGEILVTRGMIDADQLRSIIQLQIEEEMWELFSWDSGNFIFEQGAVKDPAPGAVTLAVEPLLLEGSRRMDAWDTIRSRIDKPDEVYGVNPELAGSPESPLEANTWRVLAMINGRLPIDAIVRLSNLGKFQTYVSLDDLLRAGMIVSTGNELGTTEESRSDEPAGAAPQNSERPRPAQSAQPAPHAEAEGKPLLKRFFGRKKSGAPAQETPGFNDQTGDGAEADAAQQSFSTDIALACATLNRLVSYLKAEPKFTAEDPPDALARMWWEAEQRYPKADLLHLRNGSLEAGDYDRYAELEGSVSQALLGCHDDTLEALRLLRNKLKQKARDRLGEKNADQISERTTKQYSGATATISSPDFSSRWWRDA